MLKQRVATAAVLLVVFLVVLFWFPTDWFAVALAAVTGGTATVSPDYPLRGIRKIPARPPAAEEAKPAGEKEKPAASSSPLRMKQIAKHL